jgi:hypothetical protein
MTREEIIARVRAGLSQWCEGGEGNPSEFIADEILAGILSRSKGGETASIDMVLFCPACGFKHIDEPELPYLPDNATVEDDAAIIATTWTNPPHRSHLCSSCGHVWRPADVPTNGVEAVKTKGKADSALSSSAAGSGVVEAVQRVQARADSLERIGADQDAADLRLILSALTPVYGEAAHG